MNKNKFRVWNSKQKQFLDLDLSQSHQQCIGILDRNMREIYERDVVEFFSGEGRSIGVVQYHSDYCSYVIHSDIGLVPLMQISLVSLEIVGNMVEDYMWDESGERLVKIYEDTNS